MVINILDSHPGEVQLFISRAFLSQRLIPVPHSLSGMASAKMFGVVDFNCASKASY